MADIYVLCDERGAIRYVGQSLYAERRLRSHLAEARSGKQNHRARWIRALLSRGHRPELRVVQRVRPEDLGSAEVYWIAYFKSAGCDLVNSNDGGSGHRWSEESRRKASESHKKSEKAREMRQRIAADPAVRERISATKRGATATIAAAARIAADPDIRARRIEAMKRSPAVAANLARLHSDPAIREKQRIARLARGGANG